jgi:hypothetical protein
MITLVTVFSVSARAATEKEWTLLIFLNGNNNLDDFGTTNLKQMETVGSTDQVNVVVEWASESAKNTRRLLVQKSTDPSNVTSPILQTMPTIDMGDYKNLIDFIQWGVQNYPAKHYMVDIWDHGGGWHARSAHIHPLNISYDELSGNSITTVQLGQALDAAAQVMGHKVDVYGSDACLMAMAEVAYEVSDSVQIFVGSEETEPGRGWPYDTFLQHWTAKPTISAADLGKTLADDYVQSYVTQGDGEVTMSAVDLGQVQGLAQSISALGGLIAKLSPTDAKALNTAGGSAQAFANPDYVDLGDFLVQATAARIGGISGDAVNTVKQAMGSYVLDNKFTQQYTKVQGISLWIPLDNSTYTQYLSDYQATKWDAATHWSAALQVLSNAGGN